MVGGVMIMAKELVWYEVIDLTSFGLKYHDNWYEKCGKNYKLWDVSVCETIGRYSSEEKARDCLNNWLNEKGLDSEQLDRSNYPIEYYEDSLAVTCTPITEVGLWYDVYDEVTINRMERSYGTGAMIVKKTMTLDED